GQRLVVRQLIHRIMELEVGANHFTAGAPTLDRRAYALHDFGETIAARPCRRTLCRDAAAPCTQPPAIPGVLLGSGNHRGGPMPACADDALLLQDGQPCPHRPPTDGERLGQGSFPELLPWPEGSVHDRFADHVSGLGSDTTGVDGSEWSSCT